MKSALFLLLLSPLSYAKDQPLIGDISTAQGFERAVGASDLKNPKVEDVICRLPESVRKNFIIVENSFSAQSSNSKFPRVILFDPDPDRTKPMRFAMSFNGHKEESNFTHIETTFFNPKAKSSKDFFHYRDVVLDKEPEHTEPPTPYKEIVPGMHMSAPNPGICTQCHTEYARPIFDANPFWPRVYGSFKSSKEVHGDEAKRLSEFIASAKTDPRYKCLIGLDGLDLDEMARRNRTFVNKLARGNSYIMSERLKESEGYAYMRYTLMAGLLNCDEGLQEFIPKSANDKLFNSTKALLPQVQKCADFNCYEELAKRNSEPNLRKYGLDRIKKQNTQINLLTQYKVDSELRVGEWPRNSPGAVANLRYLMEGRGIPMGNWSMDFYDNNYRFINTPGIDENVEMDFVAKALYERDPQLGNMDALKKLFRSNPNLSDDKTWSAQKAKACSALKPLSQSSLLSLSQKTTAPKEANPSVK